MGKQLLDNIDRRASVGQRGGKGPTQSMQLKRRQTCFLAQHIKCLVNVFVPVAGLGVDPHEFAIAFGGGLTQDGLSRQVTHGDGFQATAFVVAGGNADGAIFHIQVSVPWRQLR